MTVGEDAEILGASGRKGHAPSLTATKPLGSLGGFFVSWIIGNPLCPISGPKKLLTKNLTRRFVIASAK
jgi:hypothetical protein